MSAVVSLFHELSPLAFDTKILAVFEFSFIEIYDSALE